MLRLSRFRRRLRAWRGLALVACLLAALPAGRASSQPIERISPSDDALVLTLDEALQIALVQNYDVRNARLDVRNADAQVREAWGGVMPQVDASASYTRNLKSPNPFAGSDAGGLFGALGFVDWLAYNEQARTDEDPESDPLPFSEFFERQQEGRREAGITSSSGSNPFFVPNQFQSGISVSQTLYNGQAFAAIRAAEQLKELNQRALDRQEQLIVDQVRRAFYQALLAQQQAAITAQSVERARNTVREVTLQVRQGVAPKFQRLSAEVQLANLETQLIQATNAAATALDNLKLTLGIPIEQPLRLRGDLEDEDRGAYMSISAEDALRIALEQRPDLKQAALNVQLREVDKNLTRAQFFPTLSAFANFNYVGSVPDNRSYVISDPDDPFTFSRGERGFFSQSYWNPSISAGLRLSWNLFNGFQTSAQMQQRQIAIDRAVTAQEQLLQSVQLEVTQALRDLQAAQRRILSQEQNVDRAALNYEYALARLREGVASPLEEREASEQLDQARLNHLQAVHDYLVARSAFERAVGLPPFQSAASRFQLTRLDD
ncbi:MAG: TolC family protein [Bacteroidetes bacterium]|nr:MAG: TolC family protein [Bacteroidota bacterium]